MLLDAVLAEFFDDVWRTLVVEWIEVQKSFDSILKIIGINGSPEFGLLLLKSQCSLFLTGADSSLITWLGSVAQLE